eukprot:TRINITY_DN1044_c0_g1_i1.p1 TRINITY_DN1044_c0_g1~~TRINITY_DN1044_c0_g1_i1.p1  ORF type:complete len:657 (+),score=183.91 TRINITY_DN1044_c0_g1_i1:166-2136(+)
MCIRDRYQRRVRGHQKRIMMSANLFSAKSARLPSRLLAARSTSTSPPQLMSNSEAFVETLVSREVTDCFGIVGSAYMDALDLFPAAGIRFVSVQHEQNAVHMADGYSRVSNKHGVCVAQNGPGISNFVTGMHAAFWAHSPVVAITPEAGTMTKGLGGFQEADQLPMFQDCTKYQGHVNNPARMAEITARCFDYAMSERGPTQLNIPRDFFYGENEFKIPSENVPKNGPGNEVDLNEAAKLLAEAKNPVLLVGGGVVMGNAVESAKALAEYLSAPVCTTYLHNDAFPANHPLALGPLGYLGSKAAMRQISESDVVLALGTRMSPFGTNPQYGFDYWPKDAKLVQVEIDHRRIGLTREPTVGILGDAGQAAEALLTRLKNASAPQCLANADARLVSIGENRANWKEELGGMTSVAPDGVPTEGLMGEIRPRQALAALRDALPENAVVSTDIGNSCSIANGYLEFDQPKSFLAAMTYGNCGYSFPAAIGAKLAAPERPCVAYVGDGAWGMSLNEVLTCVREDIPTTAIVFNNGQWGAEKKNQVLWFGDRYIGTQLENPSFAAVAKSMMAEGIVVDKLEDVGSALKEAVRLQMEERKTCVVEIMCTRELGDPFRRDAMKLPRRVLGKYQHTDRLEESATQQPINIQGFKGSSANIDDATY